MDKEKEHINIVWFKRDLRLQDNEAIHNALSANLPILLLYVFEQSLYNDPHYSERHWNFIKQSLQDLNNQLTTHNTKILIINSEVTHALSTLQQFWTINTVFSHQETGIKITYERDKHFVRFCKNNMIKWVQNVNNGVFRGLKNRVTWQRDCEEYMQQTLFQFSPEPHAFLSSEKLQKLEDFFDISSLTTPKAKNFQPGGTTNGLKYLHSFFKGRYKNYNSHISKPALARKGCSRLSPYVAWGNLSIRQIFQHAIAIRATSPYKKQIDSFASRLRWQVHFIQKFEMEEIMEFESINAGYRKLKKKISLEYQQAWFDGKTGYPLVDACMRCLQETGYLNFRMRALVVSFFTHNLWQPWQAATTHLSRCFLDFEPGIHYPQLQMQAGETGINMLRIYNPIKNSKEHDPEGVFIKKWIPELQNIPTAFIHEPHKMSPMEQQFNNFVPGKTYPLPIIDMNRSRKRASDTLWELKDDPLVKRESFRILKKHTLPQRGTNN